MSRNEILQNIVSENRGIIQTSDAVEAGISKQVYISF